MALVESVVGSVKLHRSAAVLLDELRHLVGSGQFSGNWTFLCLCLHRMSPLETRFFPVNCLTKPFQKNLLSPNASETKSEYRNPNKPRKILARVTVFIALPFAEQETLLRKLRLHMPSFVPQANHRLGQAVMFIGQHAQARRAQQQVSAAGGFEPKPASAEHAQKMAAGKNQNVSVHSAQAAHHPVGPRANLIRRLSSRATVAKYLPTGTLGKDLSRATAFIFTVVPFEQVTIDFRHGSETGQFAGPRRALQRTGEHLGESQSFQPLSKTPGVALAAFRER